MFDKIGIDFALPERLRGESDLAWNAYIYVTCCEDMGLFFFFLTYLFGGLTFVPLAISLILLHAHLTFPRHDERNANADTLRRPSDDDTSIQSDSAKLLKKFYRDREKDVAEGYFAVCREYVPGGINGKPPMRITPAGQMKAEESPSVYQSMYRSLFDRKQLPSMDAGKVESGKVTKRVRNVFYVVLRHGHLMLYDDSEQVEVRHVISLAHHDVSVYGGGNEIPEGELWIKRNAICLSRKEITSNTGTSSLPFFFFSENCSDKEDFYFALLQSQENNAENANPPPLAQHFEVGHIISLVQRLHSSEEQLQTRWINALVGRLFLGIYRTEEAEDFIRTKIIKKIARVKKPAFLSGIILQRIDLGDAAPFITNPRLKDLTVEGDCCVEADVKYGGGFRIEIAATARIDLGTRFKAREVNLILAVVIKKLQGHLLVRFKPPPSNRVWLAFETMPLLEMSIEPIVSSRQITYGIILRAIESRIREVLAETIVLPYWDDSPFINTMKHHFRGGIWLNDQRSSRSRSGTAIPDEEAEDETEIISPSSEPSIIPSTSDDRSMSTPAINENKRTELLTKHGHKSTHSLTDHYEGAVSSGIQRANDVPKVMRSRSFAPTANPITNTDNINIEATQQNDKKPKIPTDAASFMTQISARSQPSSPLDAPIRSFSSNLVPSTETNRPTSFSSTLMKKNGLSEEASTPQGPTLKPADVLRPPSPSSLSSRSTKSSTETGAQQPTRFRSMANTLTPSEKKQQSILSAAAAAKTWGWNTIGRRGKNANSILPDRAGTLEYPIGRGRPLPPPGQPLPHPGKRGMISSMTLPKRKSLPGPSTPDEKEGIKAKPIITSPSTRRVGDTTSTSTSRDEGLLVVQAPTDSEPASPLEDDQDGYGDFFENIKPDEDDETSPTNTMTQPRSLDSNFDSSQSSFHLRDSGPVSESYGDERTGLASWQAAEEEEARSRSIYVDEIEHS